MYPEKCTGESSVIPDLSYNESATQYLTIGPPLCTHFSYWELGIILSPEKCTGESSVILDLSYNESATQYLTIGPPQCTHSSYRKGSWVSFYGHKAPNIHL